MTDHIDLGKAGEQHAAEMLVSKGYTIRERNWRSGKFEIDIIADSPDKKQLVIVEVRTRSSNYFIDPEVTVDRTKQKQVILAANKYIQFNNITIEARFDIVGITIIKGNVNINHIEDAFYAMLR